MFECIANCNSTSTSKILKGRFDVILLGENSEAGTEMRIYDLETLNFIPGKKYKISISEIEVVENHEA